MTTQRLHEIKDDVSRSVRGAIFFAVPVIVIILVLYTLITPRS